VTNLSTNTGATALGLNVARGQPPLRVNSTVMVPLLDADRLDNLDSLSFVRTPVGNAYSVFKDDATVCTIGACAGELTLPNLPAGSYAIFAKVIVDESELSAGTPYSFSQQCTLTAGADFDQSEVESFIANHQGARVATLPLQVVHTFSSTGHADLFCGGLPRPGHWRFAKITALRIGKLSNVPG
jgi:hypothetical protein